MTWDGSLVRLFVDAAEVGSAPATAPLVIDDGVDETAADVDRPALP